MVKIAIVVYSTYGHVLTLSKAEAEGAKAAGAHVDVYQLPSGEQNDASASSGLPVITPSKLAEYDGVLFGLPSRYGTHPYAFKAFLDATGAQWASGAYFGKYAGFFVSTGTQGGGQESVIRNSVTILAHHGFLYVPLGYARAFGEITDLSQVHGGSPWGAGTIAGPSGSRQPSETELHTARIQGKSFAETVARGVGENLTSHTNTGSNTAGTANNNSGAAGAAGVAGVGAAGAAGATSATSGTSGATSGIPVAGAVAGQKSASTAPNSSANNLSAPTAQSEVSGVTSSTGPTAESEVAKERLNDIGPGGDAAADLAEEGKSAPSKAAKGEKTAASETKEKEGCCKCM